MQAVEQPAPPLPGSPIHAAARFISLEPGLYAVEVHAEHRVTLDTRFTLPCIHIDAAPSSAGRATFKILGEQPFAAAGEPAAYLRVEDETAALMLTVYRLAVGMRPPELRIMRIRGLDNKEAPGALPSEPLSLLVHVQRTGDLRAPGGAWAGLPGSHSVVEGFAIEPRAPLSAADIEYQAVLGQEWTTPWFEGGEFCGSRGLALPILGLRMRLKPEAAARHTLTYWARFAGSPEEVHAADGGLCVSGSAPLEALRVTITPRPAPAGPARKRRRGFRNG